MIKSNKVSFLSVAFIILIPLALMFQGIDFTDTGWMLTYFQNIFTSPESTTFWFHLYLTHIIGGIWNLLFGNLGLLGFRIAGVFIFWLTSILVFKIYKGSIHRNYILLGLAVGILYNFAGKITVIHYNNLSLLFTVLTVYLIKKGLTKNSSYLFFAGIAVALNGFTRLPNVLTGLYIIAIFYYHIKNKNESKALIRDMLLCLSGFTLGIVLMFGVMKLLGHFDIYINSVAQLFSSKSDDFSKYGSSRMGIKFIKDILKATVLPIICCVPLVPISFFIEKKSTTKASKILLNSLFVIASIIAYLIIIKIESNILFFMMIGFIFLTVYFELFSRNSTSIIDKTVGVMVFITITSLSLGSDTGMKVGSYGTLLGLPLLFSFWNNNAIKGKSYKTAINLLMIFFFVSSIPSLYTQTYRDNSNRVKMIHSVDSKLLKGIKTTKERATVVNELLQELDNIKIKENTLLCFESIGMVHYITETKPYISNPWPLMELPSDFNRLLKERENNLLPIIIMANKQTRNKSWPNSGPVNQSEVDKANREILNNFIDRHGYNESWSNSMFTILTPPN